MQIERTRIEQAARATGIDIDDLAAFFAEGEERIYAPGEWLFQESTPRRWAGILLAGEIEIVRGLHGASRHVATMSEGSLISEGLLLDDDAHANGAFTRGGATVWQISREQLLACRDRQPNIYYRIVSRVAVSINRRRRLLADQLYHNRREPGQMGGIRVEHDSLGRRELSDQAYYGVQTLRAMENFAISGIAVRTFDHLIEGLAMVKKAAAEANHTLGQLDQARTRAICEACDELLRGRLHDQFTVDMFQGGAGTSTNMNANEVIANLALEQLGYQKGEYQYVNPNDHVNFGQSTNDVYPTAFRLALILRLSAYMEALRKLQGAFFAKGKEFEKVLKMGRTHLQDAVPMSLGQEFHGWGTTIGEEVERIAEVRQFLHEINLGATAIGTRVTAATGYPELATKYLSELTDCKFILGSDLVEATSDTGAYVLLSGVLKRTSTKLTKICNDIRLLSSGPRCGLNEINLPQMQPGSSIMPGKVNPVIPEVVNQTSFLVIGLDLTVTLAASAGQLQLNVMEPVITYALFKSISTMENAVNSLRTNCIVGITANVEHSRDVVLNSLGIITVLKPLLGYKQCAEVARECHETGKTLHDVVVIERQLLTEERWEEVFSFENLINPKFEN